MKYSVIYEGGDSRTTPGKTVNSMWVVADEYYLYAEADPFEYDETTMERILIDEIVRQAVEAGIDPSEFDFNFGD